MKAYEESDRLEVATAKSNLLTGLTAAKQELENDPDYKALSR